jgi:DNA modification methylase
MILWNGECPEALAYTETASVDCVWTDPPYNTGQKYEGGGDKISISEYRSMLSRTIKECIRVLKPTTGCIWILINEPNADFVGSLLSSYLPRRSRIIWRERFGQYRKTKFPSGHRHLFYHAWPEAPWHPERILEESVRMRMGDKRAAGPRVPDDVWEVSRLQGTSAERVPGLPCQLRSWPVRRAILCSTNLGDTVLDPFCGGGTTAVVCAAAGREFIGVERSEEYCKVTWDRYYRETGGKSDVSENEVRGQKC